MAKDGTHRLADTAQLRIGTAGWTIPAPSAERFLAAGSHLERYAQVFGAVEVNSSFYRPHRRATWERWAAGVPDGFRFAVKLPKAMTHQRRLLDCEDLLAAFAAECAGLGDRRGPVLVQLPPSLAFDAIVATRFLDAARSALGGPLVLEPRHASWFEETADALLSRQEVARVAADPAPVPAAALPGGWSGLVYRRLHGSPQIYRSAYGPERVAALAPAVRDDPESWTIFDNTASGAATADALALLELARADATR